MKAKALSQYVAFSIVGNYVLILLMGFADVSGAKDSPDSSRSSEVASSRSGPQYMDLNQGNFDLLINRSVAGFLYRMERLEDYQIEPLKNEIEQFFRELYDINRRLMVFRNSKGNKVIIGKRLNEEKERLRYQTKKNVKAYLDRKQRKHYRRLIDSMIPPRRNSNDRKYNGMGRSYDSNIRHRDQSLP